jgi:hypothetical protein
LKTCATLWPVQVIITTIRQVKATQTFIAQLNCIELFMCPKLSESGVVAFLYLYLSLFPSPPPLEVNLSSQIPIGESLNSVLATCTTFQICKSFRSTKNWVRLLPCMIAGAGLGTGQQCRHVRLFLCLPSTLLCSGVP